MAVDVMERLSVLRTRMPALRLYALVDAAQYQQQRGKPLPLSPGAALLFDGTADAPLAHAGPWLIDVEEATSDLVSDLVTLEWEALAVSWLLAQPDLIGLVQLLQLQLDVRLPDGRTARAPAGCFTSPGC